MKLERLKKADAETARDINSILKQLSSSAKPLSLPALKKILADKNVHLWVWKDGKKVVGMGSLVSWHAPTGINSRIEDVVVDENYRGKGLGEKLTRELIRAGKRAKARHVELTSRPSRAAANELYRKLGFEQKETNVYRMKF